MAVSLFFLRIKKLLEVPFYTMRKELRAELCDNNLQQKGQANKYFFFLLRNAARKPPVSLRPSPETRHTPSRRYSLPLHPPLSPLSHTCLHLASHLHPFHNLQSRPFNSDSIRSTYQRTLVQAARRHAHHQRDDLRKDAPPSLILLPLLLPISLCFFLTVALITLLSPSLLYPLVSHL